MESSIEVSKACAKLRAVEKHLENSVDITSVAEVEKARVGCISQLTLARLEHSGAERTRARLSFR